MALKTERASSKKIIFWLFLIVFIWLAITRLDETGHTLTILASGRWYWIVPALICQVALFPFCSRYIDYVFRIFNIKLGWRKIFPVYVASKFTNVALPVATFGTVGIFLRNSRKQQVSTLNTGIGISLVMFFDVAAFVVVALASLGILSLFGQTITYLNITLLILITIVLLAGFFIWKLLKERTPPNKFVLWIIKRIAKLGGYKNVQISEIEAIFAEVGADVVKKSHEIWSSLWLAIAVHLINMLTLGLIFLAFSGHLNILAVLAAYTAGILYTIVSITPQGVGVVETVMIATIHSFGFDLSTAAVITLVFRSILYWLPVFPGFYAFSRLELKPEQLV
ncbi:hypothetical protein COT78_00975 [Candidatus Berkelbacteria bacterium CG10_big_fil_rev_8_21_14_0_10_43_13]|uniref:TIGR00374 family protein n=1 Tax=Candidatus Berkelbacteria bacterium CG10_big_fil_rev_8_21_14_0_10_43_13 TaxID=1974514 RepID=A0A2H0W970_9BACT|nr:MAG: hypothetical protein COT78_00975 [Candidatus Berkelbacteria bacterium CG10_big_fil_rev_8_21_14_0_10_43_13]